MASAGFIVRTKRNVHAELIEYVARATTARPIFACLTTKTSQLKAGTWRERGRTLRIERSVLQVMCVASDS